MFRSLFLCLLALLAACRGCDDNTPATSAPATPVVEPQVDRTFMDAQAVEAWRAQIAAQIELDAALPHPREIWKYTVDFRVDRSQPDPFLGNPSVWDAASAAMEFDNASLRSTVTSTADQAQALEAKDQELDAALVWIALGRMDDAKRCSAELLKEGEWKAVAMIAIHTGDLVALDRAIKMMADADQITKIRELVSYAFQGGKYEVAKRIATSRGWSFSQVINPSQIRQLAINGDTSFLLELLDREIVAWEKDELYRLDRYVDPSVIVADVVLLAKTDRGKAMEYARRYLALPQANVLVWTECGEGCYSDPVVGTLEFYQLVRADQSLRELYLARTRQAVDMMFPTGVAEGTEGTISSPPTVLIRGIEPGNYGGWSSSMWGNRTDGNLLTSYLIRVRQMGDVELTAFWVAMLDTFPNRTGMDRTLVFERELGRCALGLPFYQTVGDITPNEKFILEELQGGANTQMEDTWATWDKKPPAREEIHETASLLHFLVRGVASPQSEAAIRAELGIQQEPDKEESLQEELDRYFLQSLSSHYSEDSLLNSLLSKGGYALSTNVQAQILRAGREFPRLELYPDTQAELDELLASSIELVCQKLPSQCARWRPSAPAVIPQDASTLLNTPVASSQVVAPSPAPAASPAPVLATVKADPTGCTFLNGNRPKIGERYIVRCREGHYLATGEYKAGGIFLFSAFTPYK